MKARYNILLVVAFALALGAWWFVSQRPVYTHSHEESAHTHRHTHDGVGSHDHSHVGLIGKTTHSHPHVHGHDHQPLGEQFKVEGMTEVGHLHHAEGRTVYWVSAHADADNKTVRAEFWTNGAKGIEKISCDKKRFAGKLILAGASKGEILLVEDSGSYVSSIPDDLVVLPNMFLGVHSITIDGTEFPGFRADIQLN